MAREKSYVDDPIVVVFKTSNRSNAQTKLKVFKNKNVDEVINPKFKLPGIPDAAVWLEVGVGEVFIQKYQSKYKNGLKFEEYLTKNGFTKRYNNGSESTKKQIRKYFLSEEKTKGDSMKKENPNHFGLNLFIDDRDYLGVSNTFISKKFNRSKSWGSKTKKESYNLSLLKYNKKARYIDTFPVTFNVRRYLSINCPTTYHKLFCKKNNDSIVVFERGYDEITSYVKLTTRRF